MHNTVSDFKVSAARLGTTLRHVISGKHYVIKSLHSQHVTIKDNRGRQGIIGTGALDERDFVQVNFPPFNPIVNG